MGEILIGDSLERLRTLPDRSVQTIITSPPYFCLRKYGDDEREIGLEATPEAYVERLVEVFREARRVLRDDGTCWLNLGDSYAGSGGRGNQFGQAERGLAMYRQASRPRDIGLPPTALIGSP
jgi:site-specific DNA-methyltransferase (adenine-specific)